MSASSPSNSSSHDAVSGQLSSAAPATLDNLPGELRLGILHGLSPSDLANTLKVNHNLSESTLTAYGSYPLRHPLIDLRGGRTLPRDSYINANGTLTATSKGYKPQTVSLLVDVEVGVMLDEGYDTIHSCSLDNVLPSDISDRMEGHQVDTLYELQFAKQDGRLPRFHDNIVRPNRTIAKFSGRTLAFGSTVKKLVYYDDSTEDEPSPPIHYHFDNVVDILDHWVPDYDQSLLRTFARKGGPDLAVICRATALSNQCMQYIASVLAEAQHTGQKVTVLLDPTGGTSNEPVCSTSVNFVRFGIEQRLNNDVYLNRVQREAAKDLLSVRTVSAGDGSIYGEVLELHRRALRFVEADAARKEIAAGSGVGSRA